VALFRQPALGALVAPAGASVLVGRRLRRRGCYRRGVPAALRAIAAAGGTACVVSCREACRQHARLHHESNISAVTQASALGLLRCVLGPQVVFGPGAFGQAHLRSQGEWLTFVARGKLETSRHVRAGSSGDESLKLRLGGGHAERADSLWGQGKHTTAGKRRRSTWRRARDSTLRVCEAAPRTGPS